MGISASLSAISPNDTTARENYDLSQFDNSPMPIFADKILIPAADINNLHSQFASMARGKPLETAVSDFAQKRYEINESVAQTVLNGHTSRISRAMNEGEQRWSNMQFEQDPSKSPSRK